MLPKAKKQQNSSKHEAQIIPAIVITSPVPVMSLSTAAHGALFANQHDISSCQSWSGKTQRILRETRGGS